MRISNSSCTKIKFLPIDIHCFVYNFADWSFHRYLGAVKADISHFNRNHSAIFMDLAPNLSPRCQDRERILVNQAPIPEIPRENPQAVPAFFCFTAIRIENSQRKITFRSIKRSPKDAIRTNTIIAMANQFYLRRFQLAPKISRIKHDIVITESVVF